MYSQGYMYQKIFSPDFVAITTDSVTIAIEFARARRIYFTKNQMARTKKSELQEHVLKRLWRYHGPRSCKNRKKSKNISGARVKDWGIPVKVRRELEIKSSSPAIDGLRILVRRGHTNTQAE